LDYRGGQPYSRISPAASARHPHYRRILPQEYRFRLRSHTLSHRERHALHGQSNFDLVIALPFALCDLAR
jgi:hypothetical protein